MTPDADRAPEVASIHPLPRRLRAARARHLPRPLFGYIAGAAETNLSLDANRQAFDDYRFVPRVLVDVSRRSTATTLFGREYAAPFGIAPIGLTALSAYRGDIVLAEAAAQANVPMVMSGSSLIRLEEVRLRHRRRGSRRTCRATMRHRGFDRPRRASRLPHAGDHGRYAGGGQPRKQRARRLLDAAAPEPQPRVGWPDASALAARHVRAHARASRHAAFREQLRDAGRADPVADVERDFSDRGHLNWQHFARSGASGAVRSSSRAS